MIRFGGYKVRIDDYIIDGNVARSRIALDIKFRNIKRADIEQLISDARITSAFLGKTFDQKVSKNQWNKFYLNELSYAAVSESFNRDYLLYLDEVAEYVSEAQHKKDVIRGIGVFLIIFMISCIAFFKYSN